MRTPLASYTASGTTSQLGRLACMLFNTSGHGTRCGEIGDCEKGVEPSSVPQIYREDPRRSKSSDGKCPRLVLQSIASWGRTGE
jgi:hypothetical protein